MRIEDRIRLFLNEVEIKKVVRAGKVKRKVVCPPGFKVVDGHCERMSAQELLKRKRAAKKVQRKLRGQAGKLAKIQKKKAKSLRLRAMRIPAAASKSGQQTEEEK